MPVFTELVRDFNYERNLINDGNTASTTNTDWTVIKEYSNQIIIEHDEQVLAVAIICDVPAGGASIKVVVGGKTVWFKDYSASGTDIQENFIACLPIGTYSMQIYGKVKTAGETLSIKSVKAGVTRLMDVSKDDYTNTSNGISNGSSATVASRTINLPAKRITALGKTKKSTLRINVAVTPKESLETGNTGTSYISGSTFYGNICKGNRIKTGSPISGKVLTGAKFLLKPNGSPSGPVYCYVKRVDTGELLGCLGTVEASTITSLAYYLFDGGDDIQIPADAEVIIYLSYPSASGSIWIYSNGNTLSWANGANSSDGGNTWSFSSYDKLMAVLYLGESSTPIAFKNSDEVDESGKLNVRLKIDGSEVGWSTRNDGEGIGWADKETIVNLSDTASTVSIEITVSNQSGDDRWVSVEIHVYGSPWILPSEFTDAIELTVPQNATIYVITEPLDGNPTKTVGIGYLKAIPYTEELYAYATGVDILEFNHTFDILKPVANMLKWKGKGASASVLAADIRG